MNRSIAYVPALLAWLFCPSCQTVSSAPEGSPRLELEVVVDVDPSYAGKLQVTGEDFTRSVRDLVLSKADVGMRFYPVLSTQYQPKDPRPEYLMTVRVEDLDVALEHRTITKVDADPVVETFVKHVGCAVSTELTKRRKTGPPLTVGRANGRGTTVVTGGEKETREPTCMLKRETGKPELTVSRADLLQGIGLALDRALVEVVASADREVSIRGAMARPPSKPE